MQYVHCPVMLDEVLSYLVPRTEHPVMVDCTCGEGGHTHAFLEKYGNLKVIGLDRDGEIREKAIHRMEEFGPRFEHRLTWFDEFWKTYDGEPVDLVLFDLGISIFHYEESERGFSFRRSENLDMRLDKNGSVSAMDIVNGYPEQELADVIYKYGEERYSRRIAKAICEARAKKPVEKTDELASIIYSSVPAEYRRCRIHPATKTFQALRIETNRELDRITPALEGACRALKDGGRIAVITFHSLEDRQVKWFFKDHEDEFEILTAKPVTASEEECDRNPPSRSAKLRVVEKRKEPLKEETGYERYLHRKEKH